MIPSNLLNKIHNVNCFEILKQLPDESIECMIIDCPYNNTELGYDTIKFPHEEWFAELIRVAKPNCNIVLFASGKFHYKLWSIGEKYHRYDCIWDKNRISDPLNAGRMPLTQHEYVMIFTKEFHFERLVYNNGVNVKEKINHNKSAGTTNFGNRTNKIEYKIDEKYPTSIISIKKESKDLIHPSEKPFELIKYLVEMYSNKGMTILDTCSGSGVLADVCLHTDRNFICCEIDSDFYKKSVDRLLYNLEYERLDDGSFKRK